MDTSPSEMAFAARLHCADLAADSAVDCASCQQKCRGASSGHSSSRSTSCPSHTQQSHLTLRRLCALLLLCTLFSSAYSCGPGRGIGGPRRNRKLTPLVFKQHVPNMSEKTLGASGPSEGRIQRDTPKFQNLIINYNEDIVYKDEEGSGADAVMTRRCREKLNTLAVSVMNQWPGVSLRVTEGWDEDNLHGNDSLHYEGRAVDITTSDKDRTKYGMLARLAVEAGFDWVYYQSRAHIHCSVKSDSTQTTHVSGCFTTDSTVLTASGERRALSELLIGERVLSMSDKGEPIYSEVILFMDRNLEQTEQFVQLRTDGGAVLTVTPAHLVLVWNPEKALMDYVFADRIEEGDFVLVHDAHGQLSPQRVVLLEAVVRKGVVAPLTAEGTIVVNSVAASCYAIVNSQRLAHWSLSPMRLLAAAKAWLPAAAKRQQAKGAAETAAHNSTAMQQNGIHWYTNALYTLKDYVVPHEWRHQ